MILLFITFILLLAIGLPIALAMIGSSLLVIGLDGIPLSVVAQRVVTGVQSFPLLAIPLFTLAGSLMNDSGISERLFGFTRAFVGHIRGGLAQTAIVGECFLSGISGSSVADCAAMSSVFVPQLAKAGYGAGFGAALCRRLCHAGSDHSAVDPDGGLCLASQHLARRPVLGRRNTWPGHGPGDGAADVLHRAQAPVPEGSGVFLEPLQDKVPRSGLGIVHAGADSRRLPHGRVYRDRDRRRRRGVLTARRHVRLPNAHVVADTRRSCCRRAKETAVILLIVAAAAPFSWFLGIEQAPQLIPQVITQATDKAWVVLLMLNIVLLILGCFMETIAIMIILVPILIPVLNLYHIDLIHFGIVLLVNLTIGQLTPPVGVLLFVASSITKVRFGVIVREVLPYVAVLVVALLVLTYVPWLSLWFPALIYN